MAKVFAKDGAESDPAASRLVLFLLFFLFIFEGVIKVVQYLGWKLTQWLLEPLHLAAGKYHSSLSPRLQKITTFGFVFLVLAFIPLMILSPVLIGWFVVVLGFGLMALALGLRIHEHVKTQDSKKLFSFSIKNPIPKDLNRGWIRLYLIAWLGLAAFLGYQYYQSFGVWNYRKAALQNMIDNWDPTVLQQKAKALAHQDHSFEDDRLQRMEDSDKASEKMWAQYEDAGKNFYLYGLFGPFALALAALWVRAGFKKSNESRSEKMVG